MMILVLILLAVTPAASWAGVLPHMKTACVSYGIDGGEPASLLQEYATKFDILINPAGREIANLKSYNPNLIVLRYDNFTNIADRRDGKWLSMEDYCYQNQLDIENMFVHFRNNTVIQVSDTPKEDKFGGYGAANYSTNLAGVLLYDGTRYINQSGDAYAGTAQIMVPARSGPVIYICHWQKFWNISMTVATPSTSYAGTWQYWDGSQWKTLQASDGTSSFTATGEVRFSPPVDWKWSVLDSKGGFWVRFNSNGTGTPPVISKVAMRKFFVYQGVSGKYMIPGWDPDNDANGDGFVDASEMSLSTYNASASARVKWESRIPDFYWVPERFMVNVGDPSYRAFNAGFLRSFTTETFSGGGFFDGIFEDNSNFSDGSIPWNYSNRVGYYTLFSGGEIVEYPGSEPGIQYTTDYLVTSASAYSSLQSIGKILIGNPSQIYADNQRYNFTPLNRVTISDGTLGGYFASNSHDGIFREFWIITANMVSDPNSTAWGDPVTGADSNLNYGKDSIENGKILIAHVRSIADTNPTGFTVERERMFSLAYFYLINDNNKAYFAFTQGNNFNTYWWWGAMNFNVGRPTGAFYTYQTGTDSAGQNYKIIARDYENALVLVKAKPTSSSRYLDSDSPVTRVNLPSTMYPLQYDGSVAAGIGYVNMKNIDGAILLINATPSPPPSQKYPAAPFGLQIR